MALVGAASAVTVAVVKATKATAEHGDEIDKNSQKLQVSAEQYQKLAFAAERCGTSITTIATANKTLRSSNFTGNMYDAVKAVAAIKDPSERAAKAVELFGKKAGQEMLPLLNSGAKGVEALFNEVDALGGVMSDKAVKAAAEYEDSLTNLQTAFGGFKTRMTSEFLPGITDIMNGFAQMLSGKTNEGSESVKKGAADIVTNIRDMAPEIGNVLTLIGEILIDNIPMFIDMGFDLAKSLLEALFNPDNVYKTVYNALDLILGITESISDAANSKAGQNAIDELGGAIARAIWDAIKNHFKRNSDKFYQEQEDNYGIQGLFDTMRGTNGSHASGLSYVPYDGYTATLHRGERIVSAGQNERYADNSEIIAAIDSLGDRIANMQMLIDGEMIVGYVDNGLGKRTASTGRLAMA